MHQARKTFIKGKSWDKISNALHHNIRSHKYAVFVTGTRFITKALAVKDEKDQAKLSCETW